MPTVAALAPAHRAIAIDLPGFGDSAKPLRAPYHAKYFAGAVIALLEEPHGEKAFWTRLPTLQTPSLFGWGRQDQLVPLRFAEHVRRALPAARHLELDCGHVPQLERPQVTHDAILRFLSG